MKIKLLALFFALSLAGSAIAGHISGGEMYYVYLGPGAAAGTDKYRFTLRLFRECNPAGPAAPLDASVKIAVFRTIDNSMVGSIVTVPSAGVNIISLNSPSPCILNPPEVCFQVGTYEYVVDLPRIPNGYKVLFQRCCRSNNITNLVAPSNEIGASYLATVPGSATPGIGPTQVNSSPQFVVKDTALICRNRRFTLDFGASDPDGDSLSYQFCEAFYGGASGNATPDPNINTVGPVPYSFPYSGSSPLGPDVSINPRTGLISGTAPGAGKYVISVCVAEWRNGELINEHRKDFLISCASCDFASAQLPIRVQSCDGFTVQFENLAPSPLINSYSWDFGVIPLTNDTSNLEKPVYTYADTGVYIAKLIVNKGQQCSDSATTTVAVYPGFFPGFTFSGSCIYNPFQFNDTTRVRYGAVNFWRWDFGEPTVGNDTSRIQNPSYLYPNIGTKQVELIVATDKGCRDTIITDVEVRDKPLITFPFRDTLICSIDTLQLGATSIGNFSWGPQVNIINPNTPNPLVFPKQTINYILTVTDNGCINSDSIRVRVKDRVTVNAGRDTVICATDAVQLNATSDGLAQLWTNAATLSDPTVLNPIATPTGTITTYQITSSLGNCRATDEVTIRTVPYPVANAGPDTIICFNTTARLNASIVGSQFRWFPVTYLSNPGILNPLVTPPGTVRYLLSVTDTLGCPKPGRDTVTVVMLPKVRAFAGNDTTIVAGQPLQLNATGGQIYSWSPFIGLTNPFIANPISILNASIDSVLYKVLVSTPQGCLDSAYVKVRVFKTNPDIFVPTGFSPNGDGRNDVFRPIPVGVSRIRYFRVFNRWGNMVFSTSDIGRGWDGKVGGKAQPSEAYVWLVEGIDYTGKPIFKKGTVMLIR